MHGNGLGTIYSLWGLSLAIAVVLRPQKPSVTNMSLLCPDPYTRHPEVVSRFDEIDGFLFGVYIVYITWKQKY